MTLTFFFSMFLLLVVARTVHQVPQSAKNVGV